MTHAYEIRYRTSPRSRTVHTVVRFAPGINEARSAAHRMLLDDWDEPVLLTVRHAPEVQYDAGFRAAVQDAESGHPRLRRNRGPLDPVWLAGYDDALDAIYVRGLEDVRQRG